MSAVEVVPVIVFLRCLVCWTLWLEKGSSMVESMQQEITWSDFKYPGFHSKSNLVHESDFLQGRCIEQPAKFASSSCKQRASRCMTALRWRAMIDSRPILHGRLCNLVLERSVQSSRPDITDASVWQEC